MHLGGTRAFVPVQGICCMRSCSTPERGARHACCHRLRARGHSLRLGPIRLASPGDRAAPRGTRSFVVAATRAPRNPRNWTRSYTKPLRDGSATNPKQQHAPHLTVVPLRRQGRDVAQGHGCAPRQLCMTATAPRVSVAGSRKPALPGFCAGSCRPSPQAAAKVRVAHAPRGRTAPWAPRRAHNAPRRSQLDPLFPVCVRRGRASAARGAAHGRGVASPSYRHASLSTPGSFHRTGSRRGAITAALARTHPSDRRRARHRQQTSERVGRMWRRA
eukprot:360565-Chlamydomonas_euryale.AAC.4